MHHSIPAQWTNHMGTFAQIEFVRKRQFYSLALIEDKSQSARPARGKTDARDQRERRVERILTFAARLPRSPNPNVKSRAPPASIVC
jgi:hypothetical protein